MAGLRILKRRLSLLVAILDIAGIWDVAQVTGALSAFAEAALDASLNHLIAREAAAGRLVADPPPLAETSGLVVIGMGKLGARELNYSSDIDLIILYDQERVQLAPGVDAQTCFVKLARDLVRLMQSRTGEGYVFRTDLRLRPDPGATPIALSMAAAEGYYESLGQNWERAAMIKARPVAGDRASGQAFLDRLQPFIWRKYLDYAAIDDIHSIKRQIHAHKGHGSITVAGHDIKLGRGGIREIEFFVQTQQLIAGGRDSGLRVSDTCGALTEFARTGRIEPEVAAALIADYGFLRRLEHRLQMIGDEQTHALPADEPGLVHIACFLGFPDLAAFTRALLDVLTRVQARYGELFENAPDLGSAGSLAFTGTEDDPETLATLKAMGYADASQVAGLVRAWHHGRYRATRSVRARELLTMLMPRLLGALAATSDPDGACRRFDEFLARLPTGVQLFSLFYANPRLIDFVAGIMGTAPALAELLGHNPILLDGVLAAEFFAPLPPSDALAAELAAALGKRRDFQDALDIARRFANDAKFQVGVQVLRQVIDTSGAGDALSHLADAIFAALVPVVEAEFARRHGQVPGGNLVILGLGKLGGREMTFASDLDLILVYDHDPHASASDGPQPLPPALYYARLCQRVINALTALTPEGRLYEVDMRLRPSGNAGPIAVQIESFARYQREAAWTWEQMAMTRARPIFGAAALIARVHASLRESLIRPREPARLAADVVDMRQRIAASHPTEDPWNLKHVRGGLLDLEFLAQYLLLAGAGKAPGIITGNTAEAFRRLSEAGLIAPADATRLAEATLLFRTLQGLLRLCTGQAEHGLASIEGSGLAALLAQAGGAADFPSLAARLQASEALVRETFDRLVAGPARTFLDAAATAPLNSAERGI